MKQGEIARLKESITEAKDKLERGLVTGDAASQLIRMIWYYEDKIEEVERNSKK